jgi:predicted DNA-binding protein
MIAMMESQITVTLPDRLYRRVQSLAHVKRRQMAEAIVEHLEATLPESEDLPATVDLHQQQSTALAREEVAYMQLHPQLKVTHFGRYVAIYQGALLDTDDTFGALVERVRRNFPQQVVWLTQVKEEPIQTIVKRGNRLVCNGE